MSFRLSELITEFAAVPVNGRIKFVQGLSDDDLDICRVHFEKNWGLFGDIFINEYNRRKLEKRNDKLNELGL